MNGELKVKLWFLAFLIIALLFVQGVSAVVENSAYTALGGWASNAGGQNNAGEYVYINATVNVTNFTRYAGTTGKRALIYNDSLSLLYNGSFTGDVTYPNITLSPGYYHFMVGNDSTVFTQMNIVSSQAYPFQGTYLSYVNSSYCNAAIGCAAVTLDRLTRNIGSIGLEPVTVLQSLIVNVTNMVNGSGVTGFCANLTNSTYSSSQCTTGTYINWTRNTLDTNQTSLTLPLTSATAFNGSSTDASPNAILATLNGKTLQHGTFDSYGTLVNLTTGVFGNALKFEGNLSSGYVDMNISSSLNVNDATTWTVCTWVNQSAINYNTNLSTFHILGYYPGGQPEWDITYNNATQAYTFATRNSTITLTASTGSNSALFNTLHYVCGAVNKNTNNQMIYLDGVLKQNLTATAIGNIGGNLTLRLGHPHAAGSTTGRACNCTIDEVRIWNASLSAAEILAEMNSAFPVRGQNLVASYSFELNNITAGASLNTTADTNYLVNGSTSGEGAYYYDGTNDYLRVTNGAAVNQSGSITVSAWTNFASITGGTTQRIVHRRNGNNGYILYKFNANFVCAVGNGSAIPVLTSTTSVSANSWHMGTCIYDMANNNLSVYVDGVFSGSTTAIGNIGDPGNDLFVGSSDSTPTNQFNGSISNVRVYSRALSDWEVRDLYNRQSLSFGSYDVFLYNVTGGAAGPSYFNQTRSVTWDTGENLTIPTYQALISIMAKQLFTNNTLTGFNITNNMATNTTVTTSLMIPANNGSNNLKLDHAGNYSKNQTCTASSLTTSACEFTDIYDAVLTLDANNGSTKLSGVTFTIVNQTLGGTLYNNTITDAITFNLLQGYQYNIRGNKSSYITNTTLFSMSNTTLTFNSTLRPVTLTITFKDEQNRTTINGTNISLAVIDATGSQTTYTTTTGTVTISGTVPPGDYTFRYGATGYSLRDFYYTIPEDTTNLTMYLLIDSVYSAGVVEVRNYDGSIVSGAVVKMIRYYGDPTIPNEVQMGTTNDKGEAVFVAEVVTSFYTWQVEVDGVTRYSTTIPELLVLESDGLWHKIFTLDATATEETNQNTGFAYSFTPGGSLTNGTSQEFTFTINTSFWTINSCTFQLINGTNSAVLGTNTSSCTGNTTLRLTTTTPQSGTIRAVATVTTDDFTNYYQTTYGIYPTDNSTFTVKNLFDDIKEFNGSGFNDNSRFILAAIIIIMVTLGVANKTDLLGSPEETLILITALVGFFSYLDWMNLGLPGVPFPWVNQYLISLLLFLFTVGAVLRKRGVLF